MQLPTATTQKAERHLKRQRVKQVGRRLDSGNDDGDLYAAEVERHDAAAHRV